MEPMTVVDLPFNCTEYVAAPALRAAEVGLAMGISGTEVAKEASGDSFLLSKYLHLKKISSLWMITLNPSKWLCCGDEVSMTISESSFNFN
jgi:hypothetical protein